MATWGEGNFDNDDAVEYLGLLAAKLVATISEVVDDRTRRRPAEDGEGLLMPSVELLALLCERYNAAPPKPASVSHWAKQYIAAFDRGPDPPGVDKSFRTQRRKAVENTFRWLQGVAESYWESEAEGRD
jgi:hypothetical protein